MLPILTSHHRQPALTGHGGGTLIYRIAPAQERSARAWESAGALPFIEIAAVPAQGNTVRDKERACSAAHALAMEAFLGSEAEFAAVLEDDAIVHDGEWVGFRTFDLFIPFAHNRQRIPFSKEVRPGVLPQFGTQAYLCSRTFAARYLPLLRAGGVADHANHVAAQGLRTGSYAGNVVEHDLECPSMISEERRLACR
jgi:hypothetical protein